MTTAPPRRAAAKHIYSLASKPPLDYNKIESIVTPGGGGAHGDGGRRWSGSRRGWGCGTPSASSSASSSARPSTSRRNSSWPTSPRPPGALGAWLLGGALSLIGALCYAELASTYPRSGGDYVYLSRAFGPWCGFLFGWAQLAVILTGSIGADGLRLRRLRGQLFGIRRRHRLARDVGAAGRRRRVVVLSVTNVLGVVLGKWMQNLLSLLKVVGLGAIVVVGFKHGARRCLARHPAAMPRQDPGFGLAMILVLYAYGGWNDAAFVAADVRNRRNIIRALLLGTAHRDGHLPGRERRLHPAASASRGCSAVDGGRRRGPAGAGSGRWRLAAISVLVMVSALGAINGSALYRLARLLDPGGRQQHLRAARPLEPRLSARRCGRCSIQAAITLVMIVGVGTAARPRRHRRRDEASPPRAWRRCRGNITSAASTRSCRARRRSSGPSSCSAGCRCSPCVSATRLSNGRSACRCSRCCR